MPGLRLVAELGGDGSGFDRMMNSAHGRTKQFASQAIAPLKNLIAGAFTVGAITQLARKTIEFGSHLRDVSNRLGVNVEWLQETGFAAKQAGADVDKLTAFLEKLGVARAEALGGGATGEKKAAAFGQFGISEAQLRSSSLQGLFDQIAEAYRTGNQQKLLPAAREVGGRSAGELVAAFVEGLDANRQLARDSGAVLSGETVDQLKMIADQFTTLGHKLMVDFAPAILLAADAIQIATDHIKQSGSFLGAASVGFEQGFMSGIKDESRSGFGALGEGIRRALDEAWQAGSHATLSAAGDATVAAEARAELLRRMEVLRKAKEANPGDFEALVDLDAGKKTAKARRSPMATDALVGIGNFLGRNPSLVNSVANQQLQEAKAQTSVLKEIRDKLPREMKETSPGILVPGF